MYKKRGRDRALLSKDHMSSKSSTLPATSHVCLDKSSGVYPPT